MLTGFIHVNIVTTHVFCLLVIFLQIAKCQDSPLYFVGHQHYNRDVASSTSSNQSDPLSHPGFVEYCQLSKTAYSGNEGSSVPGYALNKVLVVISPGQRPLNVDFDNITSPSINCDFEQLARTSHHKKVKSFPEVSDIYRHMRSKADGFKIYKPYSSSDACRNEELSPLGSIQHILLGEYLSQKYRELKLGEPYSQDWSLSASSIHDEAVYQSLFAFLHGLLHEKNLARLPVSKSLENFCTDSSSQSCSCPKTAYLSEKISKGLRKGFLLFKDVVKIDRKINAKLRIPRDAEISPRQLVTFLSSWLCDVGSRPCRYDVCLDVAHSTLDDIFLSANNYFNQITASKVFRSFADLHTYPFFQRLFGWFDKDDSQMLSIFAGEEEFIVAILSVLGIPVEKVPPQASRIVFEIHESLTLNDDVNVVRIFFNGVDVTSFVPVETYLENAIMLQSLKDYYSKAIVSNFRNENYADECLS